MTKDDIYIKLKNEGITAGMIARSINASPALISEVIRKGKGSRRAAAAIAAALDMPFDQVFPYYNNTAQDLKAKKQAELTKRLAKYA